MASGFRIVALPAERFAALFERSDAELRALGARRMVADDKPGYPCRVSLVDAEIGETVLLLPFVHHDVDSPYRSAGPIFVRQGAATAAPAAGEIPELLRGRLLSVRAFDAAGMMVAAEVVEGRGLEACFDQLLAAADVQYLHVHNARPGCYNCAVVRA